MCSSVLRLTFPKPRKASRPTGDSGFLRRLTIPKQSEVSGDRSPGGSGRISCALRGIEPAIHRSAVMKNKQSLLGRIKQTLGREQTSLVLLAITYVLTGRAGLAFGYLSPVSTVIFPPAGLALGAFLVLGYRVWPVILLASTLLYAS